MLGAMTFESKRLPVDVDAVAPDASDVRLLLTATRGGLPHFELAGNQVAAAHPVAITRDRAKPFHHEEAFIRFRPYAVHGNLEGKNPLPADRVPLA